MHIPSYHAAYPFERSHHAAYCPTCGLNTATYQPSRSMPPPDGLLCPQCGEWISPPYCPECGETRCACPPQEKEEAA